MLKDEQDVSISLGACDWLKGLVVLSWRRHGGGRRAVEEVNYIGRAGKVSLLVALLRLPSRALLPRFESLRSELRMAFVSCSQWSTFSLFQWLTAIVSKPSPVFIMSHDSITIHKRRWKSKAMFENTPLVLNCCGTNEKHCELIRHKENPLIKLKGWYT